MRLFDNKFLVLFLILIISFYFFPVRVAHAGGVVDFFSSVINAVITVSNVAVNFVVGSFEVVLGSIPLVNQLPGIAYISDDGACRLQNASSGFLEIYNGKCDSGKTLTVISSELSGCFYQVPITFYNPVMNQGYEHSTRYAWYADYYDLYYENEKNLPDVSARYSDNKCSILDPSGDHVIYLKPDLTYYNEPTGAWFGACVNIRTYRDSQCSILDPNGMYKFVTFPKNIVKCESAIWSCESCSYSDSANDDASRDVAIYRFTLPAYADNDTLKDWFFGIKGQVGSGFTNLLGNYDIYGYGGHYVPYQYEPSLQFYTPENVDSVLNGGVTPLVVVPYSQLCSGNVCKFTDATIPENSYVVYAAKILGDFATVYRDFTVGAALPLRILERGASSYNACPESYRTVGSGEFSVEEPIICITLPNKFMNTDNNANFAGFPNIWKDGYTLGNALMGPFKTGTLVCPSSILTVTKSGAGSGTVTSNPAGIDCGSACSHSFASSTPVTLTSSPDSGSVFSGWSVATGTVAYSDNNTYLAAVAHLISQVSQAAGPMMKDLGKLVGIYSGIEGIYEGTELGQGAYALKFTVDTNKTINTTFSLPALPGDFSLSLGGSVACNSVPLSWTSSSGAQAYRILRGSPRVDISPYQPYTALNYSDTTVSQKISYQYQIEAYNSAGTKRSNTINVSTPYCPPTLNFSANPTDIFQGQSVTLSWATTYTTSCAASGGWSGSKALNGSEIVVPLPPPQVTYTLTCSGLGGSVSASATINISPLLLPDWREIIPR